MLPLILISGFLGAGKTTLMKKLLVDARERGIKVAVIVNEFGAVDVDGAILRAAQVEELTSIAGGCACCAGQEEFLAVLTELSTRPQRPDFVVVEASGLADPVSIYESVAAPPFQQWVRVAHSLCVADASNTAILESEQQPLVQRQVALADTIVVNKTDLVDHEAVSQLEARLHAWNEAATMVRAIEGAIDFSPVWGADTSKLVNTSGASVAAHATSHSFFCPLPHPVERKALEAQLAALEAPVWRCKGFVRLRGESGLFLVQWSAGNWQISPFYANFGWEEPSLGLVFIGARLDSQQLIRRFGGHSLLGIF